MRRGICTVCWASTWACGCGFWSCWELLDKTRGVVKDAEGVVVRVEIDPRDQEAVDAATAAADAHEQGVYLRHMPLGIWLQLDKYTNSPCAKVLEEEQPDAVSIVQTNISFCRKDANRIRIRLGVKPLHGHHGGSINDFVDICWQGSYTNCQNI